VKRAGSKLSYANVMSTIAVFLVLGGATAFAASKVGPHRLKANSVTTPKIKANAVTTRKIRKNAVSRLKIRDGSIDDDRLASGAVVTSKIADGAVTAAKLESAGMPFSRVTDRLRGTARLPFVAGQVYPLTSSTYKQPVGRDDQYVAGFEVEFAAGCEPPRSAIAELLIDPTDPQNPTPDEIAAQGGVSDEETGASTRTINFAPSVGLRGLASFAPKAATDHTFAIYMQGVSCNNGATDVVGVGAGVDVIGTK
jgi:hypothetical protein